MRLRKVSINDRGVQKKYRVLTNATVSFWRDEFDCDGHTTYFSYTKDKSKPDIGTNKMEHITSSGYLVNGFRTSVAGG